MVLNLMLIAVFVVLGTGPLVRVMCVFYLSKKVMRAIISSSHLLLALVSTESSLWFELHTSWAVFSCDLLDEMSFVSDFIFNGCPI